MELTPEMLEKAKQANTPEELLALAAENGITLTEDEAASCFAQLHPTMGELSDDELDNVSGGGGGCGSTKTPAKRLISVTGRRLDYRCPNCHNDCWEENSYRTTMHQKWWYCCVCSKINNSRSGVTQIQMGGNRNSFPVSCVTMEV